MRLVHGDGRVFQVYTTDGGLVSCSDEYIIHGCELNLFGSVLCLRSGAEGMIPAIRQSAVSVMVGLKGSAKWGPGIINTWHQIYFVWHAAPLTSALLEGHKGMK
jgi:hypothetical protein